jgi:hypothetical protein
MTSFTFVFPVCDVSVSLRRKHPTDSGGPVEMGVYLAVWLVHVKQ